MNCQRGEQYLNHNNYYSSERGIDHGIDPETGSDAWRQDAPRTVNTNAKNSFGQSMNLEDIKRAVESNRFRVTKHALEEARNDQLPLASVFASVLQGEVIERYPDDVPFPSCLILGTTVSQGRIHSVWAYNREFGWAILVTVYRPDPERWFDGRTRRSK